MADLTTSDKVMLEKLFQMKGGFVLDFSDITMGEFFKNDLKIDIYDEEYDYKSGSKANRMRGFWIKADNKTVGNAILKLIEYIEFKIVISDSTDHFTLESFPEEIIMLGKEIAERLLGRPTTTKESESQATFKNGEISITLQKEVFDRVQKLLNDGHYSHAVEEAYKIVRAKLKSITGQEKATDAFNESNYEKIFGHKPVSQAEKDFCKGVKFLHMSIQFLRNEKAHTPAGPLDKNLAIHYISLASLAYDLINTKQI